MFSGSALLEFGRKLGIWSIPGVTLHFHASHSKCQHHDTIIIWKSRAPVCSTHKLYSFVEPCFPGNAWPWHQPRPYERTWQNTSLISRLIWDAVHCLLLGCDWQLVWTHSVLPLNRQELCGASVWPPDPDRSCFPVWGWALSGTVPADSLLRRNRWLYKGGIGLQSFNYTSTVHHCLDTKPPSAGRSICV